MIEVRIPAQSIARLDRRRLPPDWRSDTPPAAVRALGDAWVQEARSVALEVSSVVVPEETNYLLNPAHPSFRRIAIGKPRAFRYDARLGRRGGAETARVGGGREEERRDVARSSHLNDLLDDV